MVETREGVSLSLSLRVHCPNHAQTETFESPLAFLFENFRQKLDRLLPRPDSSKTAPSATQSGQLWHCRDG